MSSLLRLSYSREYDTQLYRVTLHAINQTIVLPEGFLISSGVMKGRCVVGCTEVSHLEAVGLGFVFPATQKVSAF